MSPVRCLSAVASLYDWCFGVIENAIGIDGRWRCFRCCHHVSRGRHSKRSQRKPRRPSQMDSMGYGLPVFGKAIIALATVWPLVVGGRLLDRFGMGLRGAPRDALIADAVSKDQRGERLDCTEHSIPLVQSLVCCSRPFYCGAYWHATIECIRGSNECGDETPAWIYRSIFGIGAVLGFASHPNLPAKGF